MARQPLGGSLTRRPNKAALSRMKLGMVVVSIAAFVGNLSAVSYLNPGIKVTVTAPAAAQTAAPAAAVSSSGIQAGGTRSSTRQQVAVAPLARTRGS